ncbi:efflux RND transporter periplasmic adaptor subunit [Leeuwenhoekiella sp. NPDC079379]|uniref:efflux RND transporter periplasmic adaptor subunit n=1 Tax=Leeuwenhoekiella sp. NPDC079379 TaxID=3364122 RepID=UPI0037CA27C4
MNKSVVYILIAAVLGLGLGYILFNTTTKNSVANDEASHEHSANESVQLYTCSMHPQIIREEPDDCPICGMDLVEKESNAFGLSANQFKMSENAMALADIQTWVIGNSSESNAASITLSGKIAVNENETATQSAHFDGRIETLTIKSLGQQVAKGQRVATIYSPELVAAQQELITASKIKETQPRLYAAVRNKFKNLMISSSVLNEIEKTGTIITRFPIYSNVSGVVTEISVTEGAHVMNGSAIFKVSNLSSIWAEFDVYERQLSQLEKGQNLAIKTNAYPNKTFTGEISFIDPILNTDTRTVIIRATLKNSEDLFKPGMFVSATVENNNSAATTDINIPASAILWTGERSLVYVKPNPTQSVFEMREVSLGPKKEDSYSIVSGLSPGEEIVVNGTFTVDAAAQLGGKKSMMNSGVAVAVENDSKPAVLPEEVQEQVKQAIPTYLAMTEAFIASDVSKVSANAKKFKEQLDKIDNAALETVDKSHFSKITQMLTAINRAKTIENQREHLVLLNENMAAIANRVKKLNTTLYLQRCPMANDSKGAVWLSESEEIKNPYYSDTMRSCGSIISIFKS